MLDIIVRKLVESDLIIDGGFFKCMSRFTVGTPSEDSWRRCFIEQTRIGFVTYVVEIDKDIVSSAGIFVRPTFLHATPDNFALVGYLEEVATRADQLGNGYGIMAASACIQYAWDTGAYRVILDCEDDNLTYYGEKLGFRRWENCMRLNSPK